MAFDTRTVNDLSEVIGAIREVCTNNGWTLLGEVLQKGTCYTSVRGILVGSTVTEIEVLGGTGVDGSNNLTGAAYKGVRLHAIKGIAITFPATLDIHVHTNPDEVYVFLNYSVSRYGWLAFGQSPAPGIPGTGNWFSAIGTSAANGSGINISPIGTSSSITGSGSYTTAALGFLSKTGGTPSNTPDPQNFRFHHGLDAVGGGWSESGDGVGVAQTDSVGWTSGPSRAVTATMLDPLISRQLNSWNGESILLPVQPFVFRPSSKVSQVGQFGHIRITRIDNVLPGQILMLGSDKWKIYPWHQKNVTSRDGAQGASSGVDHTGTLGCAIRYDGP